MDSQYIKKIDDDNLYEKEKKIISMLDKTVGSKGIEQKKIAERSEQHSYDSLNEIKSIMDDAYNTEISEKRNEFNFHDSEQLKYANHNISKKANIDCENDNLETIFEKWNVGDNCYTFMLTTGMQDLKNDNFISKLMHDSMHISEEKSIINHENKVCGSERIHVNPNKSHQYISYGKKMFKKIFLEGNFKNAIHLNLYFNTMKKLASDQENVEIIDKKYVNLQETFDNDESKLNMNNTDINTINNDNNKISSSYVEDILKSSSKIGDISEVHKENLNNCEAMPYNQIEISLMMQPRSMKDNTKQKDLIRPHDSKDSLCKPSQIEFVIEIETNSLMTKDIKNKEDAQINEKNCNDEINDNKNINLSKIEKNGSGNFDFINEEDSTIIKLRSSNFSEKEQKLHSIVGIDMQNKTSNTINIDNKKDEISSKKEYKRTNSKKTNEKSKNIEEILQKGEKINDDNDLNDGSKNQNKRPDKKKGNSNEETMKTIELDTKNENQAKFPPKKPQKLKDEKNENVDNKLKEKLISEKKRESKKKSSLSKEFHYNNTLQCNEKEKHQSLKLTNDEEKNESNYKKLYKGKSKHLKDDNVFLEKKPIGLYKRKSSVLSNIGKSRVQINYSKKIQSKQNKHFKNNPNDNKNMIEKPIIKIEKHEAKTVLQKKDKILKKLDIKSFQIDKKSEKKENKKNNLLVRTNKLKNINKGATIEKSTDKAVIHDTNRLQIKTENNSDKNSENTLRNKKNIHGTQNASFTMIRNSGQNISGLNIENIPRIINLRHNRKTNLTKWDLDLNSKKNRMSKDQNVKSIIKETKGDQEEKLNNESINNFKRKTYCSKAMSKRFDVVQGNEKNDKQNEDEKEDGKINEGTEKHIIIKKRQERRIKRDKLLSRIFIDDQINVKPSDEEEDKLTDSMLYLLKPYEDLKFSNTEENIKRDLSNSNEKYDDFQKKDDVQTLDTKTQKKSSINLLKDKKNIYSKSLDLSLQNQIKFDAYGFLIDESKSNPQNIEINIDKDAKIEKYLKANKLNHKQKSSLHKLLIKGINKHIRGHYWYTISNAQHLADKDPTFFNDIDKLTLDLSTSDIIQRDLHRQYPTHMLFYCKDNNKSTMNQGHKMLFKVLKAIAIYDPEAGYCQAHAPIASVLIMHLNAEQAFWVLAVICTVILPRDYYSSLDGFMLDSQVFKIGLKSYATKAVKLLNQLNLSIYFLTEWFMCAFTRTFEFQYSMIIFDIFLLDGIKTLFNVGYALLEEIACLNIRDEDEFTSVLGELKTNINIINFDRMIKKALASPLTNKRIDRLRKFIRKTLEPTDCIL